MIGTLIANRRLLIVQCQNIYIQLDQRPGVIYPIQQELGQHSKKSAIAVAITGRRTVSASCVAESTIFGTPCNIREISAR